MELIFDIDQLNKHREEGENLCEKETEIHKQYILQIISFNRNKVIKTLDEAFNYLGQLEILHCGCQHESLEFWTEPRRCDKINRNIACTHSLSFSSVYGNLTMRDGYNIFGVQLFVIAYFLFQKGNIDLQWFIPKEEFIQQKKDDDLFDSGIRHYYDNQEGDGFYDVNVDGYNIASIEELKQRQISIGGMRLRDYVTPIKKALDTYVKSIGYIVKEENTDVISFLE